MKVHFWPLFALLLCCGFTAGFCADDTFVDSSTGVAFPREVTFQHEGKEYRLQATGAATRKKFFVKVYSVASYLQKGEDNLPERAQALVQDGRAKQLTLKWVHDADTGRVQGGFQESFRKTLSEQEYAQLQPEINRFIQFFNRDVHKGDEQILRWVPGGYVEVIINGNVAGSVTSVPFAKALWGIWFGSKSVVDRDQLVSLMR